MTRTYRRRQFLRLGLTAASLSTVSLTFPFIHGCSQKSQPHVVIIGGGFGGATCARYLKTLKPHIRVTIIEKKRSIITCPSSNYVIAGFQNMENIQWNLEGLQRFGCSVIHDQAIQIDGAKRTITLARHGTITADRIVLSPGIDIKWNSIEGYDEQATTTIPHAWQAGAQTTLLRKQLEDMDDGGTVIITAPAMPYRCPPAPYERASVIAWYLKNHKPKSKILLLDAKNSFTKQQLFQQAWQERYPNMIEWVSEQQGGAITFVDAQSKTVKNSQNQTWRADVLNIVPPQTAGRLALTSGLAPDDDWCQVHPVTFEAQEAQNIHILGDSIVAGAMPKSAFAANSQAKALANALVHILEDKTVPYALLMNTCYSLIAPDYGISVAATYRPSLNTIVSIKGAGGVSPLKASQHTRQKEAEYGNAWYQTTLNEIYHP